MEGGLNLIPGLVSALRRPHALNNYFNLVLLSKFTLRKIFANPMCGLTRS